MNMMNMLNQTLASAINQFTGDINIPPDFMRRIHPIHSVWICTPVDVRNMKVIHSIELPFCDIHVLKSLINEAFASIEGIKKLEHNDKMCEWIIEYGTTPFINTLPYQDRRFYNAKKFYAIKAANKAYDMFPHLHADDDDDDGIYFHPKREWSKSVAEIYLQEDNNPSSCEKKDKLFISWHRQGGCPHSSYFIKNSLKETVTIENILWRVRANYLRMLTGCGYGEDGDYMHFDAEPYKHIIKFIADPMMAREICSYMG
jgi:hypothetical protein